MVKGFSLGINTERERERGREGERERERERARAREREGGEGGRVIFSIKPFFSRFLSALEHPRQTRACKVGRGGGKEGKDRRADASLIFSSKSTFYTFDTP